MKILNPSDASASNMSNASNTSEVSDTPSSQARPARTEHRQQSLEINASNAADFTEFVTPESEMTDYEKAVVKSFQEAAEEEREDAKAKAEEAKKAVDAASSVDVESHTKNDPLLGAAAGAASASAKVSITQEQKDAFCTALITNERYTERFSLFGGRVTGIIRSRTLGETDAIEAYLRRQVAAGALVTSADYGNMVRKIMLAAQIREVNGVRYAELKEPLFAMETKDGHTEPGWVDQLKIWDRQPNALAVALIQCVVEFEARYWFMVDNSRDTNFWNRGESTAE